MHCIYRERQQREVCEKERERERKTAWGRVGERKTERGRRERQTGKRETKREEGKRVRSPRLYYDFFKASSAIFWPLGSCRPWSVIGILQTPTQGSPLDHAGQQMSD